ncbi:putative intracellular protease/amidase [Propionicimonas paludicola]|uniref:Putative intracellular protease/amidase n=1 Tax=Propionicimonas paludicola TaxID=185243 RepID=A0A2A9CNY8_9ACTN|nr:type 1 glutamine amidotransferase domain-containing protein [Propionicimonas paludicola]PFG16113.1 putative intracellular protease/amidase [Propionicimonas paludicola]
MARALLVVTGADHFTLTDGTEHPTGYWAEELIELHRGLLAAGHQVDLATPGGRVPVPDAASLDLGTEAGRERQAYLEAISDQLSHPLVLAEVQRDSYDAIVIPGGHGPMQDLAFDPDLGRLLLDALDRDAVVAALCHGPAGLLSATRPDGTFAFAGRRLAAFTDAEEVQGGLADRSPYLLQSRLTERGAQVEAGAPWSQTVVVDGRLISGQNPQSSVATAAAVVAALA